MSDIFSRNDASLPLSGEEIKFLAELVIQAGKSAVEMRLSADVSTKSGPEDLVTSADTKLSTILMAGIKNRFPKDQVQSEEEPWDPDNQNPRRWFIDPIDGTKYYVDQSGKYSVMVGLTVSGKPVFGIFYMPAFDLAYLGGEAYGSWKLQDGKLEQLPAMPALDESRPTRLLISSNDVKANQWVNNLPNVEISKASSIGVDVYEVLAGLADAFVHIRPTLKAWDTAAPGAVALGCGLEIGTESEDTLSFLMQDPKHDSHIVIGRPGSLRRWRELCALGRAQEQVTTVKPASPVNG